MVSKKIMEGVDWNAFVNCSSKCIFVIKVGRMENCSQIAMVDMVHKSTGIRGNSRSFRGLMLVTM